MPSTVLGVVARASVVAGVVALVGLPAPWRGRVAAAALLLAGVSAGVNARRQAATP